MSIHMPVHTTTHSHDQLQSGQLSLVPSRRGPVRKRNISMWPSRYRSDHGHSNRDPFGGMCLGGANRKALGPMARDAMSYGHGTIDRAPVPVALDISAGRWPASGRDPQAVLAQGVEAFRDETPRCGRAHSEVGHDEPPTVDIPPGKFVAPH